MKMCYHMGTLGGLPFERYFHTKGFDRKYQSENTICSDVLVCTKKERKTYPHKILSGTADAFGD